MVSVARRILRGVVARPRAALAVGVWRRDWGASTPE